MSMFHENMKYLKKTHSALYNEITAKLDGVEDDGTVSVFKNKLGELNIKVKSPESEFFIHSNYNVQSEAERWASDINADCGTIAVMGLGLGYHIHSLIKKVNNNVNIIIIEPDLKIFKCFLENKSIEEIAGRGNITFLLDYSVEGIVQTLVEELKKKMFDNIEFKEYSGYLSLYNKLFSDIRYRLSEAIKVLRVNVLTAEFFKAYWLENFLMNTIHMNGAHNALYAEGLFKGIPAIVVSAGPSLQKNMDQLHALKNKAVIIAAGSAFTILMRNGIKPHFAAVIDGAPLIKDIYHGFDVEGISFLYLNKTYYELVQAVKKNKIMFVDTTDKLTRLFCEKTNQDLLFVPPDSSVAGFSVNTAAYFGCDPIILIGQDLALTDLKFHADGAAHNEFYENKLKSGDKELIPFKDIYGNDTYTNNVLLATKFSLENKVADAINRGFTILNATEGGIGVKNCENLELAKATEKCLNNLHNIPEILDSFYQNNDNRINIDIEDLNEYFNDIYSQAKSLKTIVLTLLELCESAKNILSEEVINNKYSHIAIEVNKYQQDMEANQFYKDYVVSSIENTIAIHKMIMENEISKSKDKKEKNLFRINFINNQSLETIGICQYIINFFDKIYKPQYLE